MLKIQTTMLLLPLVYMVHDAGVGRFVEVWARKHEPKIERCFPHLARQLLPNFRRFTTRGFAFAALEELILISLFTLLAIEFRLYSFWAGILLGFFVHLLVHMVQIVFVCRYFPFMLSSAIGICYCVLALHQLTDQGALHWGHVTLWALASAIFLGLNLKFMHSLVSRLFNRVEDRTRRLL
ncbi:MAG TPA: HXXEE domain-containing protein [bacterium]|jgi:hypothetical protein